MHERRDDPPLVVGIDARLRAGESGGVEQFVIGLASGLSSQTGSRDRFVFLCLPGEEAWLEPYVSGPSEIVIADSVPPPVGTAVHRLKRRAAVTAPWLRSIKRRMSRALAGSEPRTSPLSTKLESSGAQLIHFPSQSAFITNLPSIYQPWDLQHLHLPEFFSAGDIEAREHTYRLACSRAARVVVASEWAKADLVDRYGVEPRKVTVIPVPAPISAYPALDDASAAAVRKKLSLPPDFIFYPAQTWKHKNHLRLLGALALIRDRQGAEISLVCSGRQNEHWPAIQREVQRLGLEKQVRFVGYVTEAEMQVLYRDCRFMVFPSLFEGWGLPVVEAMSLGVPVACSRVTSLPELVGDAAILFDPLVETEIADAIWRLWDDEAERRTLSHRGLRRAVALDWRTTASEYIDLYRSLHVS
jgi:glycosyltransferase involved in cell wall biosynthesis